MLLVLSDVAKSKRNLLAFLALATTLALGSQASANQEFTLSGNSLLEAGGGAANDSASVVTAVGDIDGDGTTDLAVGAPEADANGANSGAVYVIYGDQLASSGSIDLGSLSSSTGFMIKGANAGDKAGYSVAKAGDVNGDGFGDILLGAPNLQNSSSKPTGAAYVVYGSATRRTSTLALSGLSSSNGFRVVGSDAYEQAGYSVSAAGDVNGDGIDDLATGDPLSDLGAANAGVVYVIYGSTTARGQVRLTIFDPSSTSYDTTHAHGFAYLGQYSGDGLGSSLARLDDINYDGYDDLVAGAVNHEFDSRSSSGSAYVLSGSWHAENTNVAVGSTGTPSSWGYEIGGDDDGDKVGTAVANAGDLNNDTLNDIYIGAAHADNNGSDSGAVFVVYSQSGSDTVDLDQLQASGLGYRIDGAQAGDQTGSAVANAGDLDGNDVNDVIIGSPYAEVDGNTEAGKATVVFDGYENVNLRTLTTGGYVLKGDTASQHVGSQVGALRDYSGDDRAEILVGAPDATFSSRTGAGIAYINANTPFAAATTGDAESIGSSSATLTGSVTPNGNETYSYFVYSTYAGDRTMSTHVVTSSGLSLGAESTTASVASFCGGDSSTEWVSVGSGTAATSASATLTDLEPSTTYCFRVVASAEGGYETYGDIKSFTTDSEGTPTVDTPVTSDSEGGDSTSSASSDRSSGSTDSASSQSSSEQQTPTATKASMSLSVRSSSVRLTKKGLAKVKLRCKASGVSYCKGTLTLKTKKKVETSSGKRKYVTLGTKSFKIAAGKTATVTVKLKTANRTLVKRLKKLQLTAGAKASDKGASISVSAKRTITLKAPKK